MPSTAAILSGHMEPWAGRWDGALPTPGGASGPPGVPFLPTLVDGCRLEVWIGWGYSPTSDPMLIQWTDISSRVQQDGGNEISITIGKPNESTQSVPASLELVLDNRLNEFSHDNPLCVNYPNVRAGTPVWVRLFLDGTYYTAFYGSSIGFAPEFDDTGTYAVSRLTAGGDLRRFRQGDPPLGSPLYRAATTAGQYGLAPVAYWAMEDGSASTAGGAASYVYGGTVLAPIASYGTVRWAGATGPAGSKPLVDLSAGGQLTAVIPPTLPQPNSVRIEYAVKLSNLGTTGLIASIADMPMPYAQNISNNPLSNIHIYATDINHGGLTVSFTNNAGTVSTFASNITVDDGNWHWVRLDMLYAGVNYTWTLTCDYNTGPTGSIFGRTSFPTSITVNGSKSTTTTNIQGYGQLAIWNGAGGQVDLRSAFYGWSGETSITRLSRIFSEQGEVLTFSGGAVNDHVNMGAQTSDSFINIIREIESTNAGFLYDGTARGTQFQDIADRYNQPLAFTLDGTSGQVGGPWRPIPDDLNILNSVTVSRKNGGSYTYTQTSGTLGTSNVGTYSSSISPTPNYDTDDRLPFRATWEVHKGTTSGYRYPNVTMLVHKLIAQQGIGIGKAIAGLLPGKAFGIIPPFQTQMGTETIRLCAEGWRLSLTNLRWEVTYNCSRQDYYDVFVVGDPVLGRLVGGLTVSTGAAVGGTSIKVNSDDGKTLVVRSSSFPSMYPMYLNINGIKVKCTGSSIINPTNQTLFLDGSTVIKPINVGDTVSMWRTGVIAL